LLLDKLLINAAVHFCRRCSFFHEFKFFDVTLFLFEALSLDSGKLVLILSKHLINGFRLDISS
jgi:hypothetical protein